MKKTFIALGMFLLLAGCGKVLAQSSNSSGNSINIAISQKYSSTILRQAIERTINHLQVKGKSSVQLFFDSSNYIDAAFNSENKEPIAMNYIVIKGSTLLIDDPYGHALFKVHLKRDDLQFIDRDANATIVYPSGNVADDADSTTLEEIVNALRYFAKDTSGIIVNTLSTGNLAIQQLQKEAQQQLSEARRNMNDALKALSGVCKLDSADKNIVVLADSSYIDNADSSVAEKMLKTAVEMASNNGIVEGVFGSGSYLESFELQVSEVDTLTHVNSSGKITDRLSLGLLWGFNNWGDSWSNGLSKLEGVYNLKTSFTSWQAEVQYALLRSEHTHLSVGIGYESDKYQFTSPLVFYDGTGTFTDSFEGTLLNSQSYDDIVNQNIFFEGSRLDDWSSSLVTHYITMPVTFGINGKSVSVALSAIPALAINTTHTGLKREMNISASREAHYQDFVDVTGGTSGLSPYKVDFRVDLRVKHVGAFVQFSSMPLFKNHSVDLYPIKIGFIVK